jgi:hypothetical protein
LIVPEWIVKLEAMGLSRSAIVLRHEIVQLRRDVVGVIQSSGAMTPQVIVSLAKIFDCQPSMIYADVRVIEGKNSTNAAPPSPPGSASKRSSLSSGVRTFCGDT